MYFTTATISRLLQLYGFMVTILNIASPPHLFRTCWKKNLHFLLWEHMDFNGSEIWLTFIVSRRININGNCWKSSLNESVPVLSKEGRIWFIKLTLKICLYMTFFFLISPSSFSRSLISLSENKLFDSRESEDSFWAFVYQAGEVEVYLSHVSSAGPRKSLSVLPVACLYLAMWI